MSSESICLLSFSALQAALNDKALSSRAICSAFLDRAHALDANIGAFTHLNAERILAAADAADARRANNAQLSAFDGLPVGIKDVIAVADEPLTCASRMLADFVAPYDATVTQRLKALGWIPFGRLNMDEFAMGSSTENSAIKPTRNPWNRAHAPGGSSGGSAAATAARLCPLALGSDTGGSIRQPAAFCGTFGLKPTYGRVSRFGLVAFASSLDQIGPFANSIDGLAALLDSISGSDPLDSTSAPHPPTKACAAIQNPSAPKRIGVPAEFFTDGLDPEVRTAVDNAIAQFVALGAAIVPISLPFSKFAIPTYYIAATAEASSNLSRYDGVRYGHRTARPCSDPMQLNCFSRGEGFGPEVKRRIILGTYVLSSGFYDAYYKRAQQVRQRIQQDFLSAFQQVDLILTPTTPTPAFKLGEKLDDPMAMYLADIYTISVNLAGLPALSLPCGLSSANLPIGLQLIAPPYAEESLLANAAAFSNAAPFTAIPNC